MSRNPDDIAQELLVLRCRRGEPRAFEELVRQREGRLFYFIRRLVETEEDAWDVLQQTWMRAFKGIGSLDDPGRLPAWLYRIARCAALSHWRGHYRDRSRIEPLDNLDGVEAAEEPGHFEDCEQVHLGLGRISVVHREVLTLHFLEEFSVDQLAEVLGIPPGTVKSRLFYAKRALRAAIEREEGGG